MDPMTDTACPGCFTERGHTTPCPHCGYDPDTPRAPLLLPAGTRLLGHYRIGRVLGKPGGFGITYLAWDLGLHRRVAIKEYLPRDLAGRGTDRVTLVAHGDEDGDLLRYGLDQFLGEARTLAQLDHPNIVRVHQVFEANGTAYLVMEYYAGFTLAEHLERQGGRLPEDQARALMLPILDGLRAVHAKGFLHRDVKPQNIYLARTEGGVRPILLDFGAARLAVGERSRSLSVVLTPGFAPFEQYHRKGRQGPWTDIYGVSAVLYQLVTGEAPPEANERMAEDDLKPAAGFGVSRPLSDALAAGLALAPEGRPQTVREFQGLLGVGAGLTPKPAAAVPPPRSPATATRPAPRRRWWALGVLGSLAVAGLFVYNWKMNTSQEREASRAATASIPSAVLALAPTPTPVPTVSPDNQFGYLLAPAPAQAPAPVPTVSPENQFAHLLAPVPAPVLPPGQAAPIPSVEPVPAVPIDLPAMVSIPGGRFRMGCSEGDGDCDGDEKPAHWVTVQPFRMGRYEVTQAQWQAVMGRNPSRFAGENRPVEDVSWEDVQTFLTRLNARNPGKPYRLPTEAEWEYAARGGQGTRYWWGNDIREGRANCNGCDNRWDNKETAPVGSFAPNAYGLYDTAGNVSEWVQDCYHDDYTNAPTDGSEWLDSCASARRVVRGGSWNFIPWSARVSSRVGGHLGIWDGRLGVRLAQDL